MKKVKIKLLLPDYKDLLRYGIVESDVELNSNGVHTRICKIRYMGILYHLKMVNNKVESLLQWDGFSYMEEPSDIALLSQDELVNMLMFSDRDRKKDRNAERVYWLCIKEINARIKD